MPLTRKPMIYFVIGIPVLLLLLPVIVLAIRSVLATKPTNLGVVDGRLAACPNSPNCVSTQAADVQHKIEPLPFDGNLDAAMRRLKAVISAIPRMKVITAKDEYLHAEATSPIFRFVDDVEFFMDRDGKVIHFRSASRVGYSDLGVNRARLDQIVKAFKQQK